MGLIRNEGFDFHHTDYLLELADSLGDILSPKNGPCYLNNLLSIHFLKGSGLDSQGLSTTIVYFCQ